MVTKRLVSAGLMLCTTMAVQATDENYTVTRDRSYGYEQDKTSGLTAFAELLYWKTHITTFPYALTAMADGQNFNRSKIARSSFLQKTGL